MNIFSIIHNLYTNRSCKWIKDIDEAAVQPYVIQRWLCMNDMIRVQTRWLDKYVFVLSPKQYLSLAWSILPKTANAPRVKYIKQLKDVEEFEFIFERIRKHMKLSDNDFNANRDRILELIKNDMVSWFSFYGVPKKYWKKYQLDFRLIKKFGITEDQAQKGLGAWGL